MIKGGEMEISQKKTVCGSKITLFQKLTMLMQPNSHHAGKVRIV